MQKNLPDAEINKQIELAAEKLREGGIVAFPTETVYGLGANALSDTAVAKIYAAKGRPSFNPLIVHVASVEQAQKYVVWNETAQKLAEKFWPGSLTFVLQRKSDCELSLLVSAGLDCVAVRMPAHPVAMSLLEKSGLPLAAPSANISGRISPTLASHVADELGDKVDMILDGGACSVGLESTIIDLTCDPVAVLRKGKVTAEELSEYVNLGHHNPDIIKAAGMMKSHYAPAAKMRLNAREVKEGEALLAFGKPLLGASRTLNLSESENLEEAAANLFRMLRELDEKNPSLIAVMPIPDRGIGASINDRLQRAAAPKV